MTSPASTKGPEKKEGKLHTYQKKKSEDKPQFTVFYSELDHSFSSEIASAEQFLEADDVEIANMIFEI